ncbi:MAG: radical SAM protein, partial [Thermoleophilia bacterium]
MNICFVIPPPKSPDKVPERVYGCTFTFYRQPELPILYAAAVLEEAGHTVALRDFSDSGSWEDFCAWVDAGSYDIYIFHTVLLAGSIDQRAGEYITRHTAARVIYFGPQPTLKPAEFLFHERCLVARGEAEPVIRDIVAAIDSGRSFEVIRGLSWLRRGKMVENETAGVIDDLDSLPFPARRLVADDPGGFFNPK